MAKTYKRKTYRKRTYKKKEQPLRYKVADAAYEALKIAKRIKDFVNIEYKEFNTDVINTAIDRNPGYIYNLCQPVQGIASNERIGDSIKMQRLTFRGTVVQNTTSLTTRFRFILFQGKAEDGKTYVVSTDLLESSVTGNYILSSKLEEEKYNTKFLVDKTYTLDTAKSNIANFKIDMPLNWHLNFQPASTNIKSGGLYLLVLSDKNIISSEMPTFYFNCTVSYTDD